MSRREINHKYRLFLILNSAASHTRTKFSLKQKMALEALYKENRYPSQGVIEEFAKVEARQGNRQGLV